MKKIIIVFLTILISCTSCLLRDNPIIKIKNETSVTIDSLEVFAYPTNKTVFRNIKPNEKRNGIISFKNIPKTDGGIGAIIYNNNKSKFVGLAYYTNGASLSYGFKITIKNDTILVEDF